LRAIYDADRRLVPCAVTGRALAAAALAYSLEKTDPLLVCRTFRARIRAAQEKYRKRLMEEDGLVIVRRKDLGAV
jgi:hypothetical protein